MRRSSKTLRRGRTEGRGDGEGIIIEKWIPRLSAVGYSPKSNGGTTSSFFPAFFWNFFPAAGEGRCRMAGENDSSTRPLPRSLARTHLPSTSRTRRSSSISIMSRSATNLPRSDERHDLSRSSATSRSSSGPMGGRRDGGGSGSGSESESDAVASDDEVASTSVGGDEEEDSPPDNTLSTLVGGAGMLMVGVASLESSPPFRVSENRYW